MSAADENRTLGLLAVDFPPSMGGIQTLTVEVYSRLADLTRLIVAPAADPRAVGRDGSGPALPVVRTHHGSGRGRGTLGFLREAAALLAARRSPPYLLHCNHLFAGYAGWWLRVRYGLPYVVWIHGEELTRSRHHELTRVSLSGASAILTNSACTAGHVRDRLRHHAPPPIHIVPLGAPADWIAAPPTPARAAGVPVILTIARLSRRDRYKGIDMGLRAMAELRRRGLGFRYRIAGDGDDRGYLEQLARELGLGGPGPAQVAFLGRVPPSQMMALVDSCDVFLLASREQPSPRGVGYEGFGIVLIEAGARARPVVAGRSGGIPDAVGDGESGLLVDPTSADDLASALERLLRSPELRHRLGLGGRARVEARFNWDAAARRVREIHDQIWRQF